MKKSVELFAVAAPGAGRIVAAEAAALQLPQIVPTAAGVAFHGGLRELYLANLHLRSASRILARIGELRATDFAELYRKAVRLPWGSFIRPGTPLQIRATSHKSRLIHSGRIAETLHAAITQALGGAPLAGGEGQLILARFEDDHCVLSIDSSGELLHRRGYRLRSGAAPLRETLAATILQLLDWDGATPLCDPMCGAGTIPIEAALLARRLPPGSGRRFAFMEWPGFRPGLWQVLRDEAARRAVPLTVPIIGVDEDPAVLAVARENAARAGVDIDLCCSGIEDLPPRPGGGLVLCNPPYGIRLGDDSDPAAAYRLLGESCRRAFPGWRIAFLAPDETLARATGLPVSRIAPLVNGGIPVGLYATRQVKG